MKSLRSLRNFLTNISSSHPTLGTSGRYSSPSQVSGYLPNGLHPSRHDDCLLAFVFILNFVDAPFGAARIEELRHPLALLLGRFCETAHISPDDARMLIALSRLLIRAITRQRMSATLSHPTFPSNTRITKKHHPLYSFLLNCSKKRAFEYFGVICHDALLNAPTDPKYILRSRKYDLALHLETFLDCVPLPPTAPRDFVPDQRTDYVDAALYILHAYGKNGIHPKGETAAHYAFTWRQTIRKAHLKPVVPHPAPLSTLAADDNQVCTEIPAPSEHLFNDDDEESAEGNRTLLHSYGSVSQSALQEGESAEEHSRWSLIAPEEDLPVQDLFSWIRHQGLARNARINSSISYWWDRSCPTLAIDINLWRLTQSGSPEAAVAWLIKHTGLAPQHALGLTLLQEGQALSDETMFLDLRNQAIRYKRPLEWCGYNSDRFLIAIDGCEASSRDVTIPLPPLVWQGLEPYCHHRSGHSCLTRTALHDRFFITDTEPFQPLSLNKVNRFLRRELSAPTSITLHSLSRSFRLLYGGRFGLDEIVTCYISGRVPYFLRAPMFYTRVRLADLAQRYWNASRLYAKGLEELTADNCPDDAVTALRTLVNTTHQLPDDILSSAIAFGSKAIPRSDTVSSFFQDYRSLLADLARKPSLDDHRVYFNHFMIYSFLAFGYATAIRPVSDATIPDNQFKKQNANTSTILVADKDNQRYAESRFIPLSPMAYQLITSVIEGRKSLIEYLNQQGMLRYVDLANKEWPIFFLFQPDFRVDLLKPKNIREHLDDVNLGNRYRVPLNANRHYFRTHLWPLLPSRLLHAILGHQHQGSEWMGRISVSDLEKARDLLTGHIDDMLVALNIVPLSFKSHQ